MPKDRKETDEIGSSIYLSESEWHELEREDLAYICIEYTKVRRYIEA